MNEEIRKNPFNFNVTNDLRHPCEQIPIKNDDEFRADVVDTKKFSDRNKENVPPKSSQKNRCLYVPTMVSIKQFDQKF